MDVISPSPCIIRSDLQQMNKLEQTFSWCPVPGELGFAPPGHAGPCATAPAVVREDLLGVGAGEDSPCAMAPVALRPDLASEAWAAEEGWGAAEEGWGAAEEGGAVSSTAGRGSRSRK